MSLASRFRGSEGVRRLIAALLEQDIICGDEAIARRVAQAAIIMDVAPGEFLVRQDGEDNDTYFILSGSFRVLVNGREIAIRKAGDHVGEMAAVDPSSPRSASVIASTDSVVAKLDEASLANIADAHPAVWRAIARALCRRLDQRRQFHMTPNEQPIIFIGSSSESLPVAEVFAEAIPSNLAKTRIWTRGVFNASSFPIDDLTAQIKICDFAVLVAAPDDQVTSRGTMNDAPRDNVVFELGLFMGAISRTRTFLLEPKGESLKLPSDLKGINTLRYDSDAANLSAAIAGAAVDLLTIIGRNGAK